jgi:uncharacterized protein YgiM (DUF1202 family)
MKNRILRMLAVPSLVMLGFCAAASGAPTAPVQGAPYVVASTSGVKVRGGPGTDTAWLGALGLGSVAYVSKKSADGKWGYVTSAKTTTDSWGKTSEGWIPLEFCCKGAPSKWVVTANTLNIRKSADVNSARVGQLPKDTRVTVTSIVKSGGYTWGFAAYAKDPNDVYYMSEGWVALEYCRELK